MEHTHEFKESKVNVSNGQRFVTESCTCGATRQKSKSTREKSEFHKTYGVINVKSAPPEKK